MPLIFNHVFIHNYRKNTKSTQTNAEILLHLYKSNIFLFNPEDINDGSLRTVDLSYYEREMKNIMEEVDDSEILDNTIPGTNTCATPGTNLGTNHGINQGANPGSNPGINQGVNLFN